MDSSSGAATENSPVYRFRPRLIGGEYFFRLLPGGLEIEAPNRNEILPYKNIGRVRLSYRPGDLGTPRFLAEIWPRESRLVTLSSVSAQGPFNFEDRGAAYSALVQELCRRIAAAQPGFRAEIGMPAWRWWPAAAFAIATLAALAYLLANTLLTAKFSLFAICFVFGVLFVWQVGMMLVRNRPRICEIDSLPPDIIPVRGK